MCFEVVECSVILTCHVEKVSIATNVVCITYTRNESVTDVRYHRRLTSTFDLHTGTTLMAIFPINLKWLGEC